MADIPYRTALIVGAGTGISASSRAAWRGRAEGRRSRPATRTSWRRWPPRPGRDVRRRCGRSGRRSAAVRGVDARLGEPDVVRLQRQRAGARADRRARSGGGAPGDRITAFGAFLVAQQAARRMLPHGHGAILLTGATARVKGYAHSAAFAMGKFALRGLAQSAARELAPKGIHVAHFVIDGGVRSAVGPMPADRPDSTLDPGRDRRKPISTSCGSPAAPGRWRSSCGRGSRNSEGSGSAVGTASLGRAGEIESPEHGPLPPGTPVAPEITEYPVTHGHRLPGQPPVPRCPAHRGGAPWRAPPRRRPA